MPSNARDTKLLLNQASLDMEYKFETETEGGSNNETNLSVSNSCETMCAALSFRVGLPLSPLLYFFYLRVFCIFGLHRNF